MKITIRIDGQPGPVEFEVGANDSQESARVRELWRAARAVLVANEDWMAHAADPQTIERLHRAFDELRAAAGGAP